MKSSKPNKIVEFDMKHIRIANNGKKCAMAGIDVFTKQTVIHLKKYYGYRPHEALNFLTPNEFAANFYSHSSTDSRLS